MTLLNDSDMHICTFLHILMFLLPSSQQMLDLSSARQAASSGDQQVLFECGKWGFGLSTSGKVEGSSQRQV